MSKAPTHTDLVVAHLLGYGTHLTGDELVCFRIFVDAIILDAQSEARAEVVVILSRPQ